jgi:hypothetical protein
MPEKVLGQPVGEHDGALDADARLPDDTFTLAQFSAAGMSTNR